MNLLYFVSSGLIFFFKPDAHVLMTNVFFMLDIGRYSLGAFISNGCWQRTDPDGDRLWNSPSFGSSSQSSRS